MRSILPDWEVELARWLKPFLEQLGLIGPHHSQRSPYGGSVRPVVDLKMRAPCPPLRLDRDDVSDEKAVDGP
jgi:hypothetical protein